ncbi:hypothetical protein BKK49_02855 [Rodentibacter rarus]|nr:hypothetical protein BKK49_02855 [Rodentibacter rarus]
MFLFLHAKTQTSYKKKTKVKQKLNNSNKTMQSNDLAQKIGNDLKFACDFLANRPVGIVG